MRTPRRPRKCPSSSADRHRQRERIVRSGRGFARVRRPRLARSRRLARVRGCVGECDPGCGADRGVLVAQELVGFGAPGQQLRVEKQPTTIFSTVTTACSRSAFIRRGAR
jgi:hypothetical protein